MPNLMNRRLAKYNPKMRKNQRFGGFEPDINAKIGDFGK
jgi:hypothetical protein